MIASLAMYDMPHQAAANDALWAAIRSELGFGPATLTRGADPWGVWLSDDLLLAQTCGLPYRARLHGRVQLVGTPDYGVLGCAPGYYHSVLVTGREAPERLEGFEALRFAFNDALSQSGWAAPQPLLQALDAPVTHLPPTQSHHASALAVAEGRADLAAIDVVTWSHWRAALPELTQALKVIAETAPTPGLPLITGAAQDQQTVAEAVARGIGKASNEARQALSLKGVVPIDAAAYLALPLPPQP